MDYGLGIWVYEHSQPQVQVTKKYFCTADLQGFRFAEFLSDKKKSMESPMRKALAVC